MVVVVVVGGDVAVAVVVSAAVLGIVIGSLLKPLSTFDHDAISFAAQESSGAFSNLNAETRHDHRRSSSKPNGETLRGLLNHANYVWDSF